MNATIISLTARQLLGRRRTVLLVLVALVPVLIAVTYRLGNDTTTPAEFTAKVLLDGLIVTVLLPLTALVIGTSVLGAEFEDGTAVYLLAKPIARWRIVASKLAVATGVTAAIVLVATVVSSLIALNGGNGQALVPAFSVAVVAGSLVYCTVFVLLSIVTSRAFVTGLVYVFVWEGLVTGLFSGTRVLSVHAYTVGLGGALADVSTEVLDPDLGGASSVALMVVVGVAAFVYAARRLGSWEMGESG